MASDDNTQRGNETAPAPAPGFLQRNPVVATFVLAVVVVIIDQATKWWAVSALEGRTEPVRILGNLLSLRLLRNPGAALGIGYGYTWVLTIIVVVVIAVMVRVIGKIRSHAWAIALALMLGGAIGNLIDRLVRPPSFAEGHVIDFIEYGDWFVGNVADIAIVAAAVLIVILSIRGIGFDGSRPEPKIPA
ncbi:MAG: signal peptidase II [Cellulomonadaceae bacterium]|jgi:signal peptidase II|nr:signal peptidase II [Cellulomonadaceae bacterium]